MKLKTALITVAVMLLGPAAWSQEAPKWEIAVDYSRVHFQAIDYETVNYEFGQYWTLNGGGGSVDYNFTKTFGLKAEFLDYASENRPVSLPPGVAFNPVGATASIPGNLFTYMIGPQFGRRFGKVRPYGQVLFGGAHSSVYQNVSDQLGLVQLGSRPSGRGWAGDAGVGLDFTVNQHVSIRPFEVSYLWTDFKNPLSVYQNSYRYVGGAVFTFGGKPPVMPTATCSATPASVMVGEPVTVTATGNSYNPKHTLSYAWTSAGAKLSATDTQTVTVDTAGMSEGTHTADATITDPKGPKNYNVSHCGANFNVNVPHNPPQVTCSANPSTVKPGETSTITASATSPDNSPISTYAYTASGGAVSGSGTTATLDTTGNPGGPASVTVTATDARGLTGTCTAAVTVTAPPPPVITCVSVEEWGECTFEKNPQKPWRVDNDCKDTLDKLALRLQQQPNGKLHIVGYTDEKEVVKEKTLGAQRSVNVKYYLTTDGPTKSDASRIVPRDGGTKGKSTRFYFVQDGTMCSGQSDEGTVVDESAIQGQSRTGPAPKKSHKAKPAAPPAQ